MLTNSLLVEMSNSWKMINGIGMLKKKKNQNFEFFNENIDDIPVRGTKSLSDIYQMCNVAVFEPTGFMKLLRIKNGGLQCRRSFA